MLRLRECGRPRPPRSLREGAKGVGSYRIKGWASRQQPTLHPRPSFQDYFLLMEKYCRDVRGWHFK